VISAVESFLRLGPKDRIAASPYVYKNYLRIRDLAAVGNLCLTTEARDKAVYIQITAACDWEPEHGLQIIYRRGVDVSRVSAQDGHLTHTDARDLPEDQDKIA